MKRLLLFSLLIVMLAGCRTPQQIQDRKCARAQRHYEAAAYKMGCAWQIRDSSVITNTVTVTRDTTIFVTLPGEVIIDSIPVTVREGIVNSPVNLLETRYASSMAWVENGLLRHTLTQKQSEIPATIPGAITDHSSTVFTTIKVPVPVDRPVKMPLSWIERALIITGCISLIALIIGAALKLKKLLPY